MLLIFNKRNTYNNYMNGNINREIRYNILRNFNIIIICMVNKQLKIRYFGKSYRGFTNVL